MSSCHGCSETYEPEAERPRVLKCGHSVCSQCLLQLHRQNSGVVPCPRCESKEYYADLRHVPVNLDLEAMVAGLSLQEEEQEAAAAAAAGPSPPPREEAAMPATPRVLAQKRVPFSLCPIEEITLDLPRGVEGEREGLDRRRSTTHLEFKFALHKGRLRVDHQDGAGQVILATAWDVESDAVAITPGAIKKGCGLRVSTVHQAKIVEDRDQYEVFLDGVALGRVQKPGGPSTPPTAAKVKVINLCLDTHEVSMFLVDIE